MNHQSSYHSSLPPKKGPWTKHEIQLLQRAMDESNENAHIAAMDYFQSTRTPRAIREKWERIHCNKKPFTSSEDDTIQQAVQESSSRPSWATIAQKLPRRTAGQVRDRYFNHLDPKLDHREWTDDEVDKLMRTADEYTQANCKVPWQELATQQFPGRSGKQLKAKYNNTRKSVSRSLKKEFEEAMQRQLS